MLGDEATGVEVVRVRGTFIDAEPDDWGRLRASRCRSVPPDVGKGSERPESESPQIQESESPRIRSWIARAKRLRTHSPNDSGTPTEGDSIASTPPPSPSRPPSEATQNNNEALSETVSNAALSGENSRSGENSQQPSLSGEPSNSIPGSSSMGAGLASSAAADVTTLMIRNIRKHLEIHKVIAVINEQGFENAYDMVYMPARDGTGPEIFRNLGYAFVNFKTTEDAARFTSTFHNLRCSLSKKLVHIRPALLQGFHANMQMHSSKDGPGSLLTFREEELAD